MEGVSSSRIERKYLFSSEGAVLAWLEHCLLPDTLYPFGTVSSIYYDTPALDRYQEKLNGDRVKCKIRLRWYGPGDPAEPDGKCLCYLETKRREGTMTRKDRVRVSLPSSELLADPFGLAELQDLPRLHAHTALAAEGALLPMLLVRYERRRFTDPETRARVAVDTGIRCDGVNRDFLLPSSPEPLRLGVFEIKGSAVEEPTWLGSIRGHLRRQSFSKYAQCIERRTLR